MGRIISVVSGKGGAGKSTVAAGLARLLALREKRVLLVDTDLGLCSAEFLVPGGASTVYNWADVLSGAVSLSRAIVFGDRSPDFLAAPMEECVLQDGSDLSTLLTEASGQYDYVIIDRPAGLRFDLEKSLPVYTALIVSGTDAMSIRGAEMTGKGLQSTDVQQTFLILNRFCPALCKKRQMPDVDTICDRVGAQLLGIIPEDVQVRYDLAAGESKQSAPYMKALTRISLRLLGEQVPLPKLTTLLK